MRPSHDPRHLLDACRSPGISAISHHSAAYLHGLIDDEPRLIHAVTVRGAHPAPPPDVIPHHTRALDPSDVGVLTMHVPGDVAPRELWLTTPATTVVMVAPYLREEELADLIERALERHATEEALRAVASRRRRRGRCGPARVLASLDARVSVHDQLVAR